MEYLLSFEINYKFYARLGTAEFVVCEE